MEKNSNSSAELTPAQRLAAQMQIIKKENPTVLIESMNNIKLIPLDKIDEISLQNGCLMHNRFVFDGSKVEELAADIKRYREDKKGVLESGLHQPITVRKKGDRYERIIGFRRCEAFKLLEIKDIPAHIIECTDEEAREIRSSENKQREDVSVYDEVVNTLESIFISCSLSDIDSAKTLINRYKRKENLTEHEQEILPKVEEIISREMRGDVKTVSAFYRKLKTLLFHKKIISALDNKESGCNFTLAEYIHSMYIKTNDEEKLDEILEFVYNEKPNSEELREKIKDLLSSIHPLNEVYTSPNLDGVKVQINKVLNKKFFEKIPPKSRLEAETLLQEINEKLKALNNLN